MRRINSKLSNEMNSHVIIHESVVAHSDLTKYLNIRQTLSRVILSCTKSGGSGEDSPIIRSGN